jgi:prophage regulatory protein
MVAQIHNALILRRRQVEERTGLSRSTIYAGIAVGAFPAPIKLGARAVGWLSSEVDGWISDQVSKSRQAA